jgi:AcrR family transcriptional regulator
MDTSETRLRILRTALEEFGGHGYHATSIQAIADRVGVSKAAVLYHFKTKDEILAALAEPMLDAMEAALVAAEMSDQSAPGGPGWLALTGLLEVWLAHRYLMRMSLHDLALVQGVAFDRYRDAALRANVLLAGPNPDLGAKICAAQALAMVSDPVVLFAEEPTDVLRERVLDGVRRFLGMPQERKGAGRRRGRKSLMTEALQKKARRLYERGESPETIAAEVGVSRATMYRFLRQ